MGTQNANTLFRDAFVRRSCEPDFVSVEHCERHCDLSRGGSCGQRGTHSDALCAVAFNPGFARHVRVIIVYIVSGTALIVRRLHDIGLSGWLICCSFIPGANFIFFVAMLLLPGTNGHNAYGAPQGKTAGDYLRRGQWLERRRQYKAAFQNYAIVIESEQYSRQEQDAAIQCVERLRDRLLSEGIMKFDTV